MASMEGRRHRHNLVPLAALISKEMRSEKMEKPSVRYGYAAQSRKGEDYFLVKTDCQRIPGNSSSTFSVFAVSNLSLFLLYCFLSHDCYKIIQTCIWELSYVISIRYDLFVSKVISFKCIKSCFNNKQNQRSGTIGSQYFGFGTKSSELTIKFDVWRIS